MPVRILRGAFRVSVEIISTLVHPFSRSVLTGRIRILCYHRVCDLPHTDDVMHALHVSTGAFDEQMAFLAGNGFNVITLEQLVRYRDKNQQPPPKTIIVTFDDGYRDNYLNAFTIMEKYGLKGTFFVVTDYTTSNKVFQWLRLGQASLAHLDENRQYWVPLSAEEIREMSAQGSCFGSHTKTHCRLTHVSGRQAQEELKGSKAWLEALLDRPITCFSYPFGAMNDLIRNWVDAAGYRVAVAKVGSNTLKSNFLELRRFSVSSEDSLSKFIRKVEGAYDWQFNWLMPLLDSAKRTIRRWGRR